MASKARQEEKEKKQIEDKYRALLEEYERERNKKKKEREEMPLNVERAPVRIVREREPESDDSFEEKQSALFGPQISLKKYGYSSSKKLTDLKLQCANMKDFSKEGGFLTAYKKHPPIISSKIKAETAADSVKVSIHPFGQTASPDVNIRELAVGETQSIKKSVNGEIDRYPLEVMVQKIQCTERDRQRVYHNVVPLTVIDYIDFYSRNENKSKLDDPSLVYVHRETASFQASSKVLQEFAEIKKFPRNSDNLLLSYLKALFPNSYVDKAHNLTGLFKIKQSTGLTKTQTPLPIYEYRYEAHCPTSSKVELKIFVGLLSGPPESGFVVSKKTLELCKQSAREVLLAYRFVIED